MTPDLRAIEAALLGEPYDPSNLSPEAASVVLPLVRRVVQERDELRATADLNAAIEKMEAALIEWARAPRGHGLGSDGSITMWYDSPAGLFTVEGENMLRAKRDRLASAILWWATARPKPERAPEHKALSERCILAEERVVALERELDALKAEIDMLRRERHAERQRVEERDLEIGQLRAAMEEARLTLAAEQGRAEGVLFGWLPPTRFRRSFRREGTGWLIDVYQLDAGGWSWDYWRLGVAAGEPLAHGQEPTARAAMLAADNALFESRRTRCLAKARQLQSDGVILYPPSGTHQQTPALMIDRLSDPDLSEAVLAIYEKVLFP